MSAMLALRFAVCENTSMARQWAEQQTHDLVIDSIRQVGRRTSGVIWRYYSPSAAAKVLQAAVRADVIDDATRVALLARIEEFAPAVLLTAEAEYEPAQRFRA